MKNATAFDPERNPGISEATKNPEARNEEKATNSIEGIGHGLLNAETQKLLSGSEFIKLVLLETLAQAIHKTGLFVEGRKN